MPRPAMARIYVGDVGTIVEQSPKLGIPPEIDLSTLTFRQMCNLAILCGVPVKEIIGIDNCYQHIDKIAIGGRELPRGFNLFEHCVYCRSCFLFFRLKVLPNEKLL